MTDLDTQVRAKQPEHDEMDRLYAEFKARGGVVEQLPRGAMAEAGWTGKQYAQAITNISTAARKERIEAEEKARQEAKARPKSADRVREPVISKRETWPELAPALQQALDALVDGDTAAKLGERIGKAQNVTHQLLLRLESKGKVHRRPRWRNTPWFHGEPKCR